MAFMLSTSSPQLTASTRPLHAPPAGLSRLRTAAPCKDQPCSSLSASHQAPGLRTAAPAVIEPLGCSQRRQRRDCSTAAGPNRDRPGGQGQRDTQISLNPTYLVIVGIYAGLLLLRNPYIFAALSIATIIPQNSNTTSLNSLVLFFYDSGLFMNFAEAVYCVRLMTWLSIGCSLISFALFA
ncbi:hypothetical protein DUNSADRAFT_17246 [Dunaliella salina]|uniref:Uncharacterized protein n=1 Tax=Dunaliella salina TaxID=3046 RepID=A0ABQ7H096_DUNSA|nr:hypothetical protein DUNSADRAFT_17246 [Dunaliella salina]|eukprot:KAF5840277.1 hypothetical protein DUNSADRAFT_17246 [Dunaliella salina]